MFNNLGLLETFRIHEDNVTLTSYMLFFRLTVKRPIIKTILHGLKVLARRCSCVLPRSRFA